MSGKKRFLEVSDDVISIPVAEVAGWLARCLHDPGSEDESEQMRHEIERGQFASLIKKALHFGRLQPRSPTSNLPLEMPTPGSVVSVTDLQQFLQDSQCSVEIKRVPASPLPVPKMIQNASFGKTTLMQLISYEEKRLMFHELRADGVYVRAPDSFQIRIGNTAPPVAHPTGDYDAPALAFPFTLEQFIAFEKTAGIVGQMNDDDIEALREKTPMAYELARAARYVEAGGNVSELIDAPEPQDETPAPVVDSASRAPIVKESAAERRARWLGMFEAEEKRGTRGALQRLADAEGVDRSNMGKGIAKARDERDNQRRAGKWTSQLVQNGKR